MDITRLHDLSHTNDPFWLNLFHLRRWPAFASFSSLMVIILFGSCLEYVCTLVKLVGGQKAWDLGELKSAMGMPKQKPNEPLSEPCGSLAGYASWVEGGIITHKHILSKETVFPLRKPYCLLSVSAGVQRGEWSQAHAISRVTVLAPWGPLAESFFLSLALKSRREAPPPSADDTAETRQNPVRRGGAHLRTEQDQGMLMKR